MKTISKLIGVGVRRIVRRWNLRKDEARKGKICFNCRHWQRRDDHRDRANLTFNVGICTIRSFATKSYDTCANHTPNASRLASADPESPNP